MTNNWEALEGANVDGMYPLKRCLSSKGDTSTFLTERAGEPLLPAAIKLVRSDSPADAKILSRWNIAAGLSHPNLIGILAVGEARIEGMPVIYAVTEYADDNLANVLQERPLTEAEAIHVLESTLSALEYLHGRGLAHGHIKPSNIMSVGETIKVSSDGLSRSGDGAASPPEDVYSLGLIIVELFTQRPAQVDSTRGPHERELIGIPERFREMVRGCVQPAPEARWTVAQIRESLTPAIRTTERHDESKARWALGRKWFYVSAIGFGLLLAVLLSRKAGHSPPPAELRPAPLATAPAQARSAKPAPSVAGEPVSRPAHANWRLVAYTYNKLEHARKKKRQINDQWPSFKAEVFSLHPNMPPYLVTLGGPMPREDAMRLRSQALRAGLPEDMYVQNYSH